MRLLKQALTVLGTVVVVAIIAALVVPKTAHAIVATAVQVVNTAATPVPVSSDGRNVVRLNFIGQSFSSFSENGVMNDANTLMPYTVPAGKRLVIDSVSVWALPPTGQRVFASFNNGLTTTFIPVFFQEAFFGAGSDVLQNAIEVRDYVEPGGQYFWQIQRSDITGFMNFEFQAVGHLVDCTNGGGC